MTQDLPGGEGWAVEKLEIITHNGTHLDAPYHHHSTMDGGKRAITIDEVPLEWCFQPGVKLDFRHLPDGYVVHARRCRGRTRPHRPHRSPLEIVVINTAAGAAYGQPDYLDRGCGMGRAATLWLLERGVQGHHHLRRHRRHPHADHVRRLPAYHARRDRRAGDRAAEAGASILHLHARDPKDGRPTPDPTCSCSSCP
jgi:hypothetical protein